MALTQSARLAGPSWDEEVVPALRKRLESESRTLAHRMSAISLSSADEPSPTTYSPYSDNEARPNPYSTPSTSLRPPGGQRVQPTYQQRPSLDHTMHAGPRVNGNMDPPKPNGKTDFQRARTYSSPYASNLPNGHVNGAARPKLNPTKSADAARSLSPRPVDVKPTRIPKASVRPSPLAATSSSSSQHTNGHSHSSAVTPELPYQPPLETATLRPLVPSSSTRSIVELSDRGNRQPSGLLNESAPFPTDSTMSLGYDEDPPRASVESEERPYEHLYRGEVSRNGGVGELRVGRRQEMLDIANYGHLIGNKKASTSRVLPIKAVDDTPRPRKRAGSIGGITNKERERESLYLDDEHANEIARVLDEHPLTDLDGEGSDVNSLSERNMVGYAYIPGEGDNPPSEQWTTTAGAHETRSTTPTPSMLPRASSRQQNIPPTRIPGPSSRRSSESRSTTTTTPQLGAMSRSGEFASSSTNVTSSPSSVFTPSNPRQQAYSSNTVPTPAQKRGPSPASKKSRTPPAKATKAKGPTTGKKEEEDASVAQYPTPAGDGEDMADAIPSWTQPVPREGNWDEVVLPVVARKKGLDGHYENATGSPQPKKTGKTIEPAPGTFGFDHSKYRPPRDNFETIPMDEFGRPERPIRDEDESTKSINGQPTMHDETRLPVRGPPPPPSPVPFAQYAPTSVQVVKPNGLEAQQLASKQQMEEEDKDAGCCKCVIM